MSYTIVSDICEGVGDCIPVCPVECIHWTEKTNTKGHKYPIIDDSTCIDCGACLSACPVEGAILDDWQPELQKPQSRSHNRIEIAAFAPVSPVCTVTIKAEVKRLGFLLICLTTYTYRVYRVLKSSPKYNPKSAPTIPTYIDSSAKIVEAKRLLL